MSAPAARGAWSGGAIRVLHVDSERPWRGGERQVLELMRRHRAGGDEPRLAAPADAALASRALAEGLAVHAVPMRGTWDLPSAFALAGLHRSLRPDVVHWHSARAHALGALASRIAPGPARVLSRRVDFPVRRTPGSRLLYAQPVEAIVAISGGVAEALRKSGIPEKRLRVVPSGIDLAPYRTPFDRAALRGRLGIGPGEILVLQVAALAPHKSQVDLLRAGALARSASPNLRIWIAGEGPLRAALEAEHRRLGLGERVRLLGFRDDVPDLLRAADLFCLSSYLEGLGTSILDAMAAGLPVVATRVGGIPEAVADGETGVLVPPRDPEALARGLLELAGDPVLRSAMGRRAREHAERYDVDRTAAQTRSIYVEILSGVADPLESSGRPARAG